MQWNVKFKWSGLSHELCNRRPMPRARRNACTTLSTVTWANFVSSREHYTWDQFDGLPAFIVALDRMLLLDGSAFTRTTETSNPNSTALILMSFFFLQIPSSLSTLHLWKEIMTFWTKISWNLCAGNIWLTLKTVVHPCVSSVNNTNSFLAWGK